MASCSVHSRGREVLSVNFCTEGRWSLKIEGLALVRKAGGASVAVWAVPVT